LIGSVIWSVKIVHEMTYKVSSGTFSLHSLLITLVRHIVFRVTASIIVVTVFNCAATVMWINIALFIIHASL